jgi:cytochrome c peroxidase
VPSLRNVERTFPYMHDGRFLTLEQVMKHYAGGGVTDSPTLDPLLKQTGKLGIALTTTQQAQLIAFLKTLTDTTFLTNRAFAPN